METIANKKALTTSGFHATRTVSRQSAPHPADPPSGLVRTTTVAVAFRKASIPQRIPHWTQVQHEPSRQAFPLRLINTSPDFDILPRSIHRNRPALRINQPTRLCAIVQILRHLFLQRFQTVCLRTKFNHKVGTQMPITDPVLTSGLANPALQRPGGIGRAPRTIGQNKATRRITRNPAAILFAPGVEVPANPRTPDSRQRRTTSQDENFTLRRHFKIEIGVLRAKSSKLLVRHRPCRKAGRPLPILNHERHALSLSQRIPGFRTAQSRYTFTRRA